MRPIVITRQLDFRRPLAGPDAVTRAIADLLRRNGSQATVHVSAGVVEFSGPSFWYFGFSMRRKAAPMVRTGVVTLDPANPHRILLELRFGVVSYLWPVLVACAMVAIDGSAGDRVTMLALIAGVWWFNHRLARWAYESWVREAASRA